MRGRSLFRLMGRTFGIATQRPPSIESRLPCAPCKEACEITVAYNLLT